MKHILLIFILVSGFFHNSFAAPIESSMQDDDFGEEVESENKRVFISDALGGVNIVLIYIVQKIDKFILKPLSIPYKIITTQDLRIGITNIFGNVRNITTLHNTILTFTSDRFLANTGSIITNTMLGIGGLSNILREFLLDSATVKTSDVFRLYKTPEVIYLVVFVEPSTLPDALGIVIDSILTAKFIDTNFITNGSLTIVNLRAQNSEALDIIGRINAAALYEGMKTAKYSEIKYWKFKRNIYKTEPSMLKSRMEENLRSTYLL